MKISTIKHLSVAAISGVSFLSGAFMIKSMEGEPVTASVIQEAQKLSGFNFTPAQADSMLNLVNGWGSSYDALHKLNMPNSVAPSLNFNPVPVGFTYPDAKSGFKLGKANEVQMPAHKDDLAFYTIRQLAELVRTKKISSVELTQFFIDRLEKYNPKLQFAITIMEDRALKKAAEADAEIKSGHYRGVLHGIPFGVKDLLAQKDYKTTWGSVPYKDQHLNVDATVVTRLEQAGGILIVKTTLGELAQGDVWFGGKTKNPWDITRGSSGSSAGSASAVGAGCLPFAIGSETLGSIVSPSTECGDTGLRPSFGRVSKYGAMALSWSMDKLGPITRSVEDAAIVFNAIQGTDSKDLSTIAAPFSYDGTGKTLKGYKIGYVKADFDRAYFTYGNNRRPNPNHATDSVTLAKLKELGAELVPIEYPQLPIGAMTVVLDAEAGAAFQDLLFTHKEDGMVLQGKNAWPNIFRAAQFIPATEYIQAQRARTLLIQQWYEKLKGLDLYITPSSSQNLSMTNLTGNPCVVLPNGFNQRGRPMSITFMGQLFGEGKLLQAAKIYQDATDFNQKHPSLNF
ncbi:amidase [Mucilaginibacter robiniae]|uniref:Amidase n=1 Tax=Mucilaginibacter robiniae TaxID=2728022 RepID=A0A7L5E1W7_9SPHI|nr:amidase [Mucilaginibacter robiniae]QJD96397.1 amidase [Mucilaginibacter robiniae]